MGHRSSSTGLVTAVLPSQCWVRMMGQRDMKVDLPGASGKEALTLLATSSHFTGTWGGCLRMKLILWSVDSMGSSVKQQNFKASPGFYSEVPLTWSRKFPYCLCKGGWSFLLLWAQSILTDIRSYYCHSQMKRGRFGPSPKSLSQGPRSVWSNLLYFLVYTFLYFLSSTWCDSPSGPSIWGQTHWIPHHQKVQDSIHPSVHPASTQSSSQPSLHLVIIVCLVHIKLCAQCL